MKFPPECSSPPQPTEGIARIAKPLVWIVCIVVLGMCGAPIALMTIRVAAGMLGLF